MNQITQQNNDLEEENSLNNHVSDYPDISIKMTKEQFSIFELKRRYEKNKTIIINPDFQREGNLWTEKQKSELIESILIGIPIPIIYLFENELGFKQVVDGRQRLSCIFDFINNEFTLNNLNLLTDLNAKLFEQLTPQFQAKIEDYQLLAYTIQYPTPEKVKFDIFDRVNRGGTQLNNQEMRNALYVGKVTKLLNSLAKSESFLLATGKAVDSKRMKDKYIILRFLSLFLLRTKQLGDIKYKTDIDEFLAQVMNYINNHFTDEQIEQLDCMFQLAMQNCYKILGEDAFRFSNPDKKRAINMALFESLSYILSVPLPQNINIKQLKQKIENLKQEMDQSNNFGKVDYRFEKADQIRKELINAQ